MERSSVPLLLLSLFPIWGCAGGTSSAATPAPAGASEDTPAGASENAPAGASENAPAGASENTPAGASENTPAGASEDTPAGASKNTADETEGGMEPYGEVITADAETDEGRFAVHTVDDKLFCEIPLEYLDREMVLQSRIAKAPNGAGYGGSQTDISVVAWQRVGNRIPLRRMNHEHVAEDSEPISRAVSSSNFEPILAAFEIEALSPDSGEVVVGGVGPLHDGHPPPRPAKEPDVVVRIDKILDPQGGMAAAEGFPSPKVRRDPEGLNRDLGALRRPLPFAVMGLGT